MSGRGQDGEPVPAQDPAKHGDAKAFSASTVDASRRPGDWRLVPVALGAWAGAGLGTGLRPHWAIATGGVCLVVVVVLVVRAARCGRSGGVDLVTIAAIALAGVAGATFSAGGQQQVRAGGLAGNLIAERATVTMHAEVRAPPRKLRPSAYSDEPRWAVRVLATHLSGRGRDGPVRTPLLVVGAAPWSEVAAGQRLTIQGRLAPAEPGESVAGYVRPVGAPSTVADPGRVAAAAEYLRERLRQACAGLPPDAASLLPGLVVGDTSQLPVELEEAMRTTGLTHLTAVSGANITIVAGAVLYVMTLAGTRRLVRIVVAGIAVLAFIVVCGPEPSVLRAGVMGCVGLIGVASARPGAGLPPLCLAVVLLVLVDPWLSRAAGFALSVSATTGLLLLARPLAVALEVLMPRWAALAISIPLAAQVAVSPVSVLLNPSIPLLAVPANILVAPVIAPVTVLGAVAACLAALSVWLGQLPVWVAGWGLRWVALVARTGAEVPGSTLPWPSGIVGVVAVVAVSAGLVLAVLALPRLAGRDEAPGRNRSAWVVLGAGVLVLVLVLWLGTTVTDWVRRWPPPGWVVMACDVGQGTAVAVRSSPGGVILLDAGPDPDAVDACLGRLRVHRIDLLILSHFHADHVDGLSGVLRGRPVAAALVSPVDQPASNARDSLRELAEAGVPVVRATSGTAGVLPEAEYRILGPAPSTVAALSSSGEGSGEGSVANDSSVLTWIRAGQVSIVSLGDAETMAQLRLLSSLTADPSAQPVDVVVMAHHGSATQEPELYEALAPRVTLITVGADNDYGHPAPSALRMLDSLPTTVLRTDLCRDAAVLDGDPGDGVRLEVRCRGG